MKYCIWNGEVSKKFKMIDIQKVGKNDEQKYEFEKHKIHLKSY